MHFAYDKPSYADILTASPLRSTQQNKGSAKKSSGYGHIRMKSHITYSERPPLNSAWSQYSQFHNLLPMNKQKHKQKISSFIIEQKKQRENQQIYQKLKLARRPLTSYDQVGTLSVKQNNIYHRDMLKNTNSSVSPFNLEVNDMQSLCSKMSQSIIFSKDTIETLSDQPVQIIDNSSFQRIKFIGQGKFGKVYLVKHKQTGFVCAMKIIDKKVVKQERVQQQLAKQIRIHSMLRSSNIIEFYGFFDDKYNVYILLQYATQGSVFSKLKGKSRLQQSQVQAIAKGMCQGIKTIHSMGYVHRDIKPQNIVLQFNIPKICDFGWATQCDDFHLCKSYCGTPLYLSPEMIKKQFYGNSVDIWSIGLIVYQLLVGRVPFKVWTQEDFGQILNKTIQFPQYIDRTSKCELFIRKCLQKKTYARISINQALRHPFILQPSVQLNLQYQFISNVQKVINNFK